MKISRRRFAVTVAAGTLVPEGLAGKDDAVQSPGMRLILLGTAGGPSPKRSRAAPAQVVLVGDSAFVVDCGNGVARQLALAGVPLRNIRHILVTHHHSDHNADLGTLPLLAWSTGLRTRVDVWGPPPLARMIRLFLEMSAPDIDVRRADQGQPPLEPLIIPHELAEAGPVTEADGVRISCAVVEHPLLRAAFAYRFDASDRSIVISGDTRRSADLVRLAKGADILVHEVIYPPAINEIAGSGPGSAELRRHLIDSHTPVDEVGKIASEAGVKTLVLSHFVPGESPHVPDDVWEQAARRHFAGRVIVGRDLLEIL